MASRPTGAQLRVAVAVAAAVAVLWVVGLVWFRPWIAHNDFAIFRLALERELDGHVRLVGAHSRLDVFHPGPLREWVFALPYLSLIHISEPTRHICLSRMPSSA